MDDSGGDDDDVDEDDDDVKAQAKCWGRKLSLILYNI